MPPFVACGDGSAVRAGLGGVAASGPKRRRRAVVPQHTIVGKELTAHDIRVTPDSTSWLARWMDWFATPTGAAALALGGLLVSVGSLLGNITRISILGPIVFAVLVWLSWRKKRKTVVAAAVLALFVSLALFTRAYTEPANSSFFYGGALMDTSGVPFFGHPGIPLTDDPSKGHEHTTIYSGDVADLEVSCTRSGLYSTSSRSTKLEWAQIVDGKYRTLWVPVPFLAGLAPGTARTLLSCSDWRWRLQRLITL